jgi:hypothetical protein
MTERWKYDVIKKFNNFEIRKFHSSVFADVTVHSPYSTAGSIGFRPLVTYISQNQIEMTAPVLQERINEESWVISFVMPEGKSLSSLPLAKNSTVVLREEPEHFAAAISFKGFSSWNTVKEKEAELREFLTQAKIKSTGPSRIARFDPPWMPGFLRHNEVVIPIENMSGD